ncbi:MAG: hypothetical protein SWY16_01980 [Cyanobacteriota bacterium]|nr:hypothetical protein [Cyanobacteriota bacterium]
MSLFSPRPRVPASPRHRILPSSHLPCPRLPSASSALLTPKPQLSMSYIFRLFCYCLLGLMFWSPSALASPLVERLDRFPNWQNLPPVESARGDLIYPEWMAGTWEVSSTLVDMAAPLAPEVVTPGFEGNRKYLDRPMSFHVRFAAQSPGRGSRQFLPLPVATKGESPIVADREFNGSSIARAYLGDRGIVSVKVDPGDPNRQVSVFRADRQLISIVTGRASETPAPDRFAATEFIDQVFRSESGIYFNRVETTTAYQQQGPDRIAAEQVTAIYLSPQDPDYFKAKDRPVALYRYRLDLSKHSIATG